MATKTDKEIEEPEIDDTEELEEEIPEPPKKAAKKEKIVMDASNAAEPPKKTKEREQPLDLTPVTKAIADGFAALSPKPVKERKKAETPPEEERGFLDVLGDW